MTEPEPPQLAAPGAGLPPVELQVARLFFAWMRWRTTRESATKRIERERDAILALVESCPPEDGGRRVLIKRLPGIEDSSRYWSVWMTLDHLRIVNLAIGAGIRSLGGGVVPEGTASTAAVKPDPGADATTVEAFTRSCEMVLRSAEKIPDLKTPARYGHPWFGPLDAAGWYTLAGMHLGLHRVQIERILAGLRQNVESR